MDEIFCKSCGNIHRITTQYTFCSVCSSLDYKHSRNEFPFVSPRAVGFKALCSINKDLVRSGLGLQSTNALEEYFMVKSEYFPNHLFFLNNTKIREQYYDWLDEMHELSLVEDLKIRDAYSSALAEIKYLLYGEDGAKEQLNPLENGKYAEEFQSAAMIAKISLSYFYTKGLTRYCDGCGTLGEKELMENFGEIHRYDGCIWCV